MRRAVASLAALLVFLTCTAGGSLAEDVKATFFVAPNGNDQWSGKLPQPNAAKTDGPFTTLGRARDAIRDLKGKQAPKESISVMVRGGKYYLDRKLDFGPEDSGSQDF